MHDTETLDVFNLHVHILHIDSDIEKSMSCLFTLCDSKSSSNSLFVEAPTESGEKSSTKQKLYYCSLDTNYIWFRQTVSQTKHSPAASDLISFLSQL